MPQRVHRREDQARTDLLALNELIVLKGKGDPDHFYAWLDDLAPEHCPLCNGSEIKVQNLFSHTYTDCIMEGTAPRVISLTYEFYKYRCKNPECRHIFAPEITFASVNSNLTRRLEKQIASMVIEGQSYASIASSFREMITRQAVGQNFNRWITARNEQRMLRKPPSVIAAITGQTEKEDYTLTLSCDEGIRILDILLGVDTDRIAASLKRFGSPESRFVLTDCNPTVYEAAKEALPKALHIIPAEMWLKLVRRDFIEYARGPLRWLQIRNKLDLLLEAKANSEENTPPNLRKIFSSRPELKDPYDDYHYLRDIIFNREIQWHINELDEWPAGIDDAFRDQLSATLIQYREYREEIARHEDHRDCVPVTLLASTDRLEELIRSRRCFSEEVLQAMVLYSTENDPDRWEGVGIADVINKLSSLPESSRRNEYDDE